MWDSRMSPDVERIIGDGPRDRAIEEEAPPSIVINPHSELGKELRKWEQHYGPLTPVGTRPGNPYVKREFPKMLYKAERGENGQPCVVLPNPSPWDYPTPDHLMQAQLKQESWNKAHQRIAKSDAEYFVLKGQGWCEGPTDALEAFEKQQQAFAEAAAQTAFHAQRMTEKAQRELKAADEATDAHVVDVQPRRKPGRKPKAVTGAGPVED